jgi:hypothetical protein
MATQSVAPANEGGLRAKRIEFAREAVLGEAPSNPDFKRYSDNMTGFGWSPTPGTQEGRGLGDADVTEFFGGPEEHEFTVSYWLQQFPVDATGDALDATGDGILRNSNNQLPASHTVVAREDKDGLAPASTVNGSTSKDTRVFQVGFGCKVDEVVFTGDPGSDQPIIAEVTYVAEKGRRIQIDQPDAATALDVVSTDDADTMDVVVEDEGAAKTETITLNGTMTVSGATSFDNIDAIWLTDDPVGDVTISTTGGDDLCVIRGSDYYGTGEGDRGVPVLGNGSHASAIGTSYETILDDSIQRGGSDIADIELNSVSLTVSNNHDSRTQIGTPRPALSVGNRDVSLSATLVGETESVKMADEALGTAENNIVWTLDGGTLQVDSAALTDPSDIDDEVGQSAMSLDNGFTGKGLTATAT